MAAQLMRYSSLTLACRRQGLGASACLLIVERSRMIGAAYSKHACVLRNTMTSSFDHVVVVVLMRPLDQMVGVDADRIVARVAREHPRLQLTTKLQHKGDTMRQPHDALWSTHEFVLRISSLIHATSLPSPARGLLRLEHVLPKAGYNLYG